MELLSSTIEQTVLTFLRDELLRSQDDTMPDEHQDLFSTGLVDSLSIMRLVVFVGEAFHIQVAPTDLKPENFRSVRAIGSFVLSKKAESS